MTRIPGNRLSPEKTKEMAQTLARDKKFSPKQYDKDLKEFGWILIVSMYYRIAELEKALKKQTDLREQADKLIEKLKERK